MENDSGGYLKYHFRPYIFKPLDLGHFHVAANTEARTLPQRV